MQRCFSNLKKSSNSPRNRTMFSRCKCEQKTVCIIRFYCGFIFFSRTRSVVFESLFEFGWFLSDYFENESANRVNSFFMGLYVDCSFSEKLNAYGSIFIQIFEINNKSSRLYFIFSTTLPEKKKKTEEKLVLYSTNFHRSEFYYASLRINRKLCGHFHTYNFIIRKTSLGQCNELLYWPYCSSGILTFKIDSKCDSKGRP